MADKKKVMCGSTGESNNQKGADANKIFFGDPRILDLCPINVLVTDKGGKIVYVNKEFSRKTGYSSEEVIGKNPRILKGGEVSKKEYGVLWDTVLSGKNWEGELHNMKKDKSFYWASVTICPLFDEEGNIKYFIGFQEDITLRKEFDNKYRTLYETSKDAIMVLGPNEGFIAGNNSTVKIFGCKNEEEFIKQTPPSLSPKFQPDGELSSVKADAMIKKALSEKSNFFEWVHKRMDGSTFPATVLLTDIGDQKKSLLQATVRDVTQEKAAEAELKKFNKVAVGRELRMIELKKEVNRLLNSVGKKPKYVER